MNKQQNKGSYALPTLHDNGRRSTSAAAWTCHSPLACKHSDPAIVRISNIYLAINTSCSTVREVKVCL